MTAAPSEAGGRRAGVPVDAPAPEAPSAPAPLLEARHVTFSYDAGRIVLDDVCLSVAAGELVTLLGPNGAGKSTLLNLLVGRITPRSGVVLLGGRSIAACDSRARARAIAYVPQTASVAYDYDVREFVAMGRAPYLGVLGRPGPRDYALVEDVMERMQVSHLLDKSYLQISGGERQLVNICRAIVQQPSLIVFDEPTAALDCGNQAKVLRLMRELVSQGFSVLSTTHNPEHPMLLGGTVCMLGLDGRLRSGTAGEIMTQEAMGEAYQTDLRVVHVAELGRDACLMGPL